MNNSVQNKVAELRGEAVSAPADAPLSLPFIPGELTTTALRLPDSLPFDAWVEAGRTLFTIERACNWWIGDWIRFGERKYGEKYTQAIEETGKDYSTLTNIAYVAGKVDPSRRRENVSFSHHAEVASLAPEKQAEWLGRAEKEDLTVSTMRQQLREEKVLPPPTRFTVTATYTRAGYKALRWLMKHRDLELDDLVNQLAIEAAEGRENG